MKSTLTLFFALLIMMPTLGWAASSPGIANYGNFYVGADVGVAIPQGTNISVSGLVNGSGTINYEDNAAFLGTFGYHLNPYVALESELGYFDLNYNSISGTIGGFSGPIGLDGHMSTLLGLANVLVSPIGRNQFWIPYVGAGLGFANTDSKINSITVGHTTFSENTSSNDTNLALDGTVGIDFPIWQGLSLGARYQYMWVDSSTSSTSSGISSHVGNFGANIVTAQITYAF